MAIAILTIHIHAAFAQQQQQSQETCDILDTIIEGLTTESLNSCTRNALCTVISCTTNITTPASRTVTSEITLFPCETPIAVRNLITDTFGTILNTTTSESQNVTLDSSSLKIELEQTETGICFGVNIL